MPIEDCDEEPMLYYGYPARYGGKLSDEPPRSSNEEEAKGIAAFSLQTSAKEA